MQFDDLLLLQRGGRQVYYGKLGSNSGTFIRYLQALPGVLPCPDDANPATWMLDVLAASNQPGSPVVSAPLASKRAPGSSADATSASAPQAEIEMVLRKEPGSDDHSATPILSAPTLLTGEGFEHAFYSSPAWLDRASQLVKNSCVPHSVDSSDGVPKISPSPSVFVQLLLLGRRELVSSNRNVGLNRGRVGSLMGLVGAGV